MSRVNRAASTVLVLSAVWHQRDLIRRQAAEVVESVGVAAARVGQRLHPDDRVLLNGKDPDDVDEDEGDGPPWVQ